MSRQPDRKDIMQIMPADGWMAVFIALDQPADGLKYIYRKLAAWSLIKVNDATRMEGLIASGAYCDFCEGNPEFLQYVHPDMCSTEHAKGLSEYRRVLNAGLQDFRRSCNEVDFAKVNLRDDGAVFTSQQARDIYDV